MPYSNKRMNLRPINSQKHENTFSFLGQDASTVQIITVVKGVTASGIGTATPEEVIIGSKVPYLYFEFNLNGVDNSGTAQVFHWMVIKNTSNDLGTASPNTYNQTWKRHVLKRGMEMLPEIPLGSGGTVQTKRVFTVKLPRGFQRIGDDDRLEFRYISTSASGINFCGITVFKEYR